MPTTFANSINSNPIYAARAEADAAGNTISTTYATKAELPEGVPTVTSSDDGKVLTADYTGGVASYSWETPSAGSRIVELTVGTSTWADFTAAYAQLTAGTVDGIRAKLDSPSTGFMTGYCYYADLVYVTSSFGAPSGAYFSAPVYAFSNGVNGKRVSSVLYVLDSMGGWTTTNTSTLASNIVAGAGISVSKDASSNIEVAASDPLPAHTSTESGKVLSVGATGATEWVTPSSGPTYTAGNMVSLTNNAIAVSTTAGITDIQKVSALPVSPVSTVLYLIQE